MIRRVWFFLAVAILAVFSCDITSDGATYQSDELVMEGTGDQAKSEKFDPTPERRRTRRAALSLPDNTSFKIELDLSMPINPLNNTFTYFTLVLPFRFVLPSYQQLNERYRNLRRFASDMQDEDEETGNSIDYEFLEDQRANEQRRTIYQHLENLFKKFGFDGEQCLQRAICELAEAPLGHHGLMGKLVHTIFSPSVFEFPSKMKRFLSSHGNSNRMRRDASLLPELELMEKPLDDKYTQAYLTGKSNKCWARYSSCPISLFTLLRV